MAERLLTVAQIQENLSGVVQLAAAGETIVIVDDRQGEPAVRLAVLLGAAAYADLAGGKAESKGVEATVGGVAGGLVSGAGTALSSVTGNPAMAKGARSLGRRLGRALAVGIDALDEPKKPKQG